MPNIKEVDITQVLLIEDNPFDAAFIENQLYRYPYKVNCRESLADGIDFILKNRCDVALLDLNIIDSHGEETLFFLSMYAKAFPILVISGMDESDLNTNPILLGAQDFLPKADVTSKKLDWAIRSSMERHRSLREAQLQVHHLDYISKNPEVTYDAIAISLKDRDHVNFDVLSEKFESLLSKKMEILPMEILPIDQSLNTLDNALSAYAHVLKSLGLGSKDLFDLHERSVQKATKGVVLAQKTAIRESAYSLLTDLMSRLVDTYRKECFSEVQDQVI